MLAGIIVLVVYNINSLVKVFTLLLISFYRYTRVYKFIWLPRDNADITQNLPRLKIYIQTKFSLKTMKYLLQRHDDQVFSKENPKKGKQQK